MTVSVETSYLTWQNIPGNPIELKDQVYVLATPKEPLIAMVEAIQAAGIKPRVVDLKPLALARAVNEKDAIVVSGESNSVELAIVVDDIPRMVRSVYLGGEMVDTDKVGSYLQEELNRSIAFYNDQNRATPLDTDVPVYLAGEVAGSPGLADSVANLTGRKVAQLEPPLKYPAGFPVAEYLVNIGLVLKML